MTWWEIVLFAVPLYLVCALIVAMGFGKVAAINERGIIQHAQERDTELELDADNWFYEYPSLRKEPQ